MKISKAFFVFGLFWFGMFAFWVKQSEHRSTIAKTWTTPYLEVFATGMLNRTLDITMLTDGEVNNPIRCGLFIDSVVRDPKMSHELAEQGFNSIACGSLQQPIKQ